MSTDLRLITEINMAYSNGILSEMKMKRDKFNFKQISKSAYKDQFIAGLIDGKRNSECRLKNII